MVKSQRFEVWEYDLTTDGDKGTIVAYDLAWDEAQILVDISPVHLLRVIAKQ